MTTPLSPDPGPRPGELGLCGALGLDSDRVAATIHSMAARGLTVATAESLTAGLLTAVLTSVPGSSAVVRGGLVCYATDLKGSLADVDPALLASAGPVDEQVARQLALGARSRCRASIGLGLTGVAGPDPQGGHGPGTVFVARAGPGTAETSCTRLAAGTGTRLQNRARAVRSALSLLDDALAL